MSQLNKYKAAVQSVCPDAVYVFFENEEIQHHIRVYSGDIPKTIGKGHSEISAWIGAIIQLKNEGKL
jgi:hypothetical protein